MPKQVKQIQGIDFNANYDPSYIESAFLLWYKLGRNMSLCIENLEPAPGHSDPPRANTMNYWQKVYAWDERADVLDAKVSEQVENKAIQEKVEMLTRQAKIGQELQDFGLAYLREFGIHSENTALKAIIEGAELERSTRGIPDALVQVAEMRDEELGSLVQKLLAKTEITESVIEKKTNETVEGLYKEIDDDKK